MHAGGHYKAYAAALLAVGLVAAVYFWAHHYMVSRIWDAYVNSAGDPNGDEASRTAARDAAREGLRWGDQLYGEAIVVGLVLLVLGVAAVAVSRFVDGNGNGKSA